MSSSAVTCPSLSLSAILKSSSIDSAVWNWPDSHILISDTSNLPSPFLSNFANIVLSSAITSLSGTSKNSDCVSCPSLSVSRIFIVSCTSTSSTLSLVSGKKRPGYSLMSKTLSPSESAATNLLSSTFARSSCCFFSSAPSPSAKCPSGWSSEKCLTSFMYSSMLSFPSWLVSTSPRSISTSSLLAFFLITSANPMTSSIETWPLPSLSILPCSFFSASSVSGSIASSTSISSSNSPSAAGMSPFDSSPSFVSSAPPLASLASSSARARTTTAVAAQSARIATSGTPPPPPRMPPVDMAGGQHSSARPRQGHNPAI
mmetsp:Transcript_32818/g.82752  ORF Transcript_32818/g.82752 Transcript_32818/m.82752 type:complete len:316 (-) Transcript_32818:13-960(-)